MTHICVNKLAIIGSDNGLSPGRRQAIIWNNAGILLIGPLGTNFSEMQWNAIENVVWKMEAILSRLQCVKAKIWPSRHCLGLGHEPLVCAVCVSLCSDSNIIMDRYCLSVFLYQNVMFERHAIQWFGPLFSTVTFCNNAQLGALIMAFMAINMKINPPTSCARQQ